MKNEAEKTNRVIFGLVFLLNYGNNFYYFNIVVNGNIIKYL